MLWGMINTEYLARYTAIKWMFLQLKYKNMMSKYNEIIFLHESIYLHGELNKLFVPPYVERLHFS